MDAGKIWNAVCFTKPSGSGHSGGTVGLWDGTNAIESLNNSMRMVLENCGAFPNDKSITKLMWFFHAKADDDNFPEQLFSRGRHRHRARGGHP